MFGFWRKRKAKDQAQQALMNHSQQLLIMAATETANAAQDVTTRLKERLDDSVRQFESTSQMLSDALLMCDTDGTINRANASAEALFGRTEWSGLSAQGLFRLGGSPVTTAASLWSLCEHTTSWHPSAATPLRGYHSDGHEFWIEPTIAFLTWSNGSVSVLVLIRSVDDAVAMADTVAVTKQRYNSIFEASFDAIFICQDDTVATANPAASKIFGYELGEIVGNPIAALVDLSSAEGADAGDAIGFTSAGQSLSLTFNTTPISWKGEDATLIIVRDVSDLKALEVLANRRTDNSSDMIACFDNLYRITYVNEPFASHYLQSCKGLLNKDIRTILTTDELSRFESCHRTLGIDRVLVREQVKARDVSNNVRLYDWVDHVVLDGDGNPVEYQRVGRDMSVVVERMLCDENTKIS
jgi:PAS domain S-box-containing protein